MQTIFIQFAWGDVGNLSHVQTTGCPMLGQFLDSRFSKVVCWTILGEFLRSETSIDNKLLIWLVNISFNYLCFCLLYAYSCVLVCVWVCVQHTVLGWALIYTLAAVADAPCKRSMFLSWGVACATFCLPQHDRSFFAFFIFASQITIKLFMCVEATEREKREGEREKRRCRGREGEEK